MGFVSFFVYLSTLRKQCVSGFLADGENLERIFRLKKSKRSRTLLKDWTNLQPEYQNTAVLVYNKRNLQGRV
jgi:hypothetical protein